MLKKVILVVNILLFVLFISGCKSDDNNEPDFLEIGSDVYDLRYLPAEEKAKIYAALEEFLLESVSAGVPGHLAWVLMALRVSAMNKAGPIDWPETSAMIMSRESSLRKK